MPTRWRATKWLDQTGGGRCAGPPQAGSAGGVQEGGRPVGRSRGGGPTGARVHACATLMYIRVNEALCGSRWRGLPLPVLLALQAVLRCRRCCAGTERSVGLGGARWGSCGCVRASCVLRCLRAQLSSAHTHSHHRADRHPHATGNDRHPHATGKRGNWQARLARSVSRQPCPFRVGCSAAPLPPDTPYARAHALCCRLGRTRGSRECSRRGRR